MLAVLLVVLLAVSGCGGDVSITPPSDSGGGDTASRAAAGQQALDGLVHAYASRTVTGGSVPATAAVRSLRGNARALGVRGLRMQYVDDNMGGLSAGERRRYGAGAWLASVQIAYRSAVDHGTIQMESAVVFTRRGGHTVVAAFGGHGDRVPLWLLGPARVVRRGPVAVVEAGAPHRPYPALVTTALRQVRRVLPGWTGPLVVEVPRSQDELDRALNASPAQYADIAGVTTTVDGSLDPGSPVHVFVNPAVFDQLKAKGAQVVLTHEATHVATGAPFASMPTWLLEGFADYVALAHAGVPVQVAAHQILRRIRRHGVPDHLPTTGELAPTATGLGATYELAWLTCRSIAQRFGQARLLAFYRAVDRGRSVQQAFERVLGTSQPAFVRQWRSDLTRLAAVSGG